MNGAPSRILAICTTPQSIVMEVANALNHLPNQRLCDYLIPREGPTSEELRRLGCSVIIGNWNGHFAAGAVQPELVRQLRETGYSHILLAANNSSGAGYEALVEFCSTLTPGSASFVFPDLSVRMIGFNNGAREVHRLHSLFGAQDESSRKATPDTLFYSDREYPASWGTEPIWKEFGGIFETTYRCNFQCIHCPRKVAGLDEQASIEPETFALYVNSPHIHHATLLGLGETLMNPQFAAVAATLAAKNVPVSLVTNGALLKTDILKPLLNSDLSVVVSIDSADAETFGKLRAPGWLTRIQENVRRLHEENPGTKICVNTVVSDANYKNLVQLVDLGAALGAQRLTVLNVLSLETQTDRRHGLLVPESERSAWLMEAWQKAIKVGLTFDGKPLRPSLRPCRSPWNQMYVAMNGDVYPCSFIYRIPKDEFQEYFLGETLTVPLAAFRLGNLNRNSVEEIWEGQTAQRIRAILLDSQQDRQLSIEAYQRLRRDTVLKDPLDYCRICLNRWNCAC
jgi:MoaA/NifB/PqqE/SkfB family radical SAM enzyme